MKHISTSLMIVALLSMASCQTPNGNREDRDIESWAENFEESMDQFAEFMSDFGDSMAEFTDTVIDLYCDEIDNGTSSLDDSVIINYCYKDKSIKIKRGRNIKLGKNDKYLLCKFPAINYKSLSVNYSFKVVMCDTVDSVVVRINEKLKNHLNVRYNKGCLEIGLNHVSGINMEDNVVCGYVYLPYNRKLNDIEINGTSVFRTNLPISTGSFSLDLAGATQFSAPAIIANSISVDINGTSICSAKLKAKEVELELNGASRYKGCVAANNMDLDVSGISNLNAAVSARKIVADVSGASEVTLTGKTYEMDLDVSGTSSFTGSKNDAEIISGSLSGASHAVVNCSKLLDMEVSGTSSLYYNGNPTTKIEKSSTATVRKR